MGRGIRTVNMLHLAVPAGLHTSQLDLHTIHRVFDKCGFSFNYFLTGEDDKADFSVLCDTGKLKGTII
jgi:hypothetical protein